MWTFLEKLTLAQLAWASVIVYALHYAEEGPRLVEWFTRRHPLKGLQYTQKKLNLENIILFGFNLATVILLNFYPGNWVLQGIVLGAAVGFVGNTWFHARPTLQTAIYSPGVVTACLLNPFLFLGYVAKAYQMGILSVPIIAVAVVAGLLGLPLAILLTHKVLLRENRGPTWLDWFPLRARL